MTSFLQLVGLIQHPILQLLNMVPGVIHATASIDRLEELSHQTMTDPASKQQESRIDQSHPCPLGSICFDHVSFRYTDGDREVINNFTHHFRPGSKTAITGQTGIGKTTLFRMILGFVEPAVATSSCSTKSAVAWTKRQSVNCIIASSRAIPTRPCCLLPIVTPSAIYATK